MTSARAIVAGAAFIKMTMDDAELKRGLDSAQGKLKQFSDSVKSWSNSMVNIGAVLAYPIADATKKFADFDDQMRLTAAITGATGKQFESLRQLALKLGRETSFSTSQIAAGMVALGRMGFSPKEIEMAIKHVMNLSRTTNTELSVAAEIAGNALRALGLDTSHTAEVVDILMTTSNGSAQTLTDLGEALKYAAPAARTAGESIYDVNKALGVLANVGIRGSIAGNALKRAYSELAKPEVQEYLKKFNVNVVDGNGNLRKFADILRDCAAAMATMGSAEKLNFATQVFGERAAPAALAITVDMSKIDEFLAKLDKASGSAEKVAAEMEAGIGGKLRIMMSSLEGVAIALGEIVAVTFGPFIENLSNVALVIREILVNNNELVSGILQLTGTLIGVGVGIKAFTLLKSGITALFLPIMAADKALTALIAKKIAASGASKTLAASEVLLAKSYKMIHSQSLLAATGQKIATAATLTFKGALDLICTHPVMAALAALAVAIYAVHRATAKAAAEAEKEVRIQERLANEATAAREQLELKIRTEQAGLKKLIDLEKQGVLTSQQQEEAKTIIDQLTEAYGKLGIELDTVTGKLKGVQNAFGKISEEQKNALAEKFQKEIEAYQTSANAIKNSMINGYTILNGKYTDGIKVVTGDEPTKLKLLYKMGAYSKNGWTLKDSIGYADLKTMQAALIYAMDNGLDEEVVKLEKIIGFLKKKTELEEKIDQLYHRPLRQEGSPMFLQVGPGVVDMSQIYTDLNKIDDEIFAGDISAIDKEIQKIEKLKDELYQLYNAKKLALTDRISFLEDTERRYKDLGLSLGDNEKKELENLRNLLKFLKDFYDSRKLKLDIEVQGLLDKQTAEEKKKKDEKKAMVQEYRTFLHGFMLDNAQKKIDRRQDQLFERYLRDRSEDGINFLENFMKNLEKIISDRAKAYKKYLDYALSDDSEDGENLSENEIQELKKMQEDYKAAVEKYDRYQERIDAGYHQAQEKQRDPMRTFASFDANAFAGFLFSAKSQRDYNAEMTAKATTRSEHHLRSLVGKVGKGFPIK